MKNKFAHLAIAAGASGFIALSGMSVALARENENKLDLDSSVSVGVSASTTVDSSDDRDKDRDTSAKVRAVVTVKASEKESRQEDKQKERAKQEIERRTDSLSKMSERMQEMMRISSDDKASLSADIQAQIDALIALKARIEAATSTSSLKEDVKSITGSYRIYALVMPKAAITAHADRLSTVVLQMQTIAAKLQARIDAAKAGGADVSAATSTLAHYNGKVADANVQIKAALDLIANLKPDQGDQAVFQANLDALKSAQKKLQTAQQDLKDARKDINTIRKELPKEKKTEAGASASTTVKVRD